MGKYTDFDSKLFAWLANNREGATTAKAIEALGPLTSTEQRHVSRRFTQLEDRAVLSCELRGTTRVCTVQKDLPATLAKQRWRPANQANASPSSKAVSIPATTSDEFQAAGGVIEKIPSHWDQKPTCNAVGILDFTHYLASLD